MELSLNAKIKKMAKSVTLIKLLSISQAAIKKFKETEENENVKKSI